MTRLEVITDVQAWRDERSVIIELECESAGDAERVLQDMDEGLRVGGPGFVLNLTREHVA